MLPTKYSGTSIQGTPPFRRHKIWSRKNVHIIFVSVTSIEGTAHLYSEKTEKRDTFSGYPTFILHSGGTLALKKWLRKSLNFTLTYHNDAFRNWKISIKSMYCDIHCRNSTCKCNITEVRLTYYIITIHYPVALQCLQPILRQNEGIFILYRHECFTGKYTTRKILKNYIRDPSGLFSIISHVNLSMT